MSKNMLARDLVRIAMGDLYDESVLRKALTYQGLNPEDKTVIKQYMAGSVSFDTRMSLQNVAIKILASPY